jgi:hypothetical protein
MSAAGASPVGQSVPTNVATPLTRNPVACTPALVALVATHLIAAEAP